MIRAPAAAAVAYGPVGFDGLAAGGPGPAGGGSSSAGVVFTLGVRMLGREGGGLGDVSPVVPQL